MPDVPIRKRIIQLEIIDIERTISERIAFVRIVVHVLRQHVVPLELVSVTETLSHAHGKTVVERFADGAGNHYLTKIIPEDWNSVSIQHAIEVQKASQVDAL